MTFEFHEPTNLVEPGLAGPAIATLLGRFGYVPETGCTILDDDGQTPLRTFRKKSNDASFTFHYHYDCQAGDYFIEGKLYAFRHRPEHREFAEPCPLLCYTDIHLVEALERIPELEARLLRAAAALHEPQPQNP